MIIQDVMIKTKQLTHGFKRKKCPSPNIVICRYLRKINSAKKIS